MTSRERRAMTEDRREKARRVNDHLRYWVAIILSLLTTVLALGAIYGRLGGRLDLIEYRLLQIEQKISVW